MPVAVVAEPPLPEVTVSAGTSPVTEGNAATFTVSLDSAPPAALSVAMAVSETGNVLSGTAPSTVAFAAGERNKTLPLQTDDDEVDESHSTVKVTLATGSGFFLAHEVFTGHISPPAAHCRRLPALLPQWQSLGVFSM